MVVCVCVCVCATVTISLKCTVLALGIWDRQTGGQIEKWTYGLQHCLMPPYHRVETKNCKYANNVQLGIGKRLIRDIKASDYCAD